MNGKTLIERALMLLRVKDNECEKGVPSVPKPEFQGDYEKSELTFESVLKMPLSQFKQAGLLVRVRCRHLNGEEVFIASTEKEAEIGRAEGLVVYTADELKELVKGKPSPDVMR